MIIEFTRSQIVLLISIIFLLMAGSLSALIFIIDSRDKRESGINLNELMELIYKLRKIAILLAILFLLISFIVYRFRI